MVSECFDILLRNLLNLVWVELFWVYFPIKNPFYLKSFDLVLPLQFDGFNCEISTFVMKIIDDLSLSTMARMKVI